MIYPKNNDSGSDIKYNDLDQKDNTIILKVDNEISGTYLLEKIIYDYEEFPVSGEHRIGLKLKDDYYIEKIYGSYYIEKDFYPCAGNKYKIKLDDNGYLTQSELLEFSCPNEYRLEKIKYSLENIDFLLRMLVELRTRRGKLFYGCSKYPACRFTTSRLPQPPNTESKSTDSNNGEGVHKPQ